MIISIQRPQFKSNMRWFLSTLTQDKISLLLLLSKTKDSNIKQLDVIELQLKFNNALNHKTTENLNKLERAKQQLIDDTPNIPFTF